jgi:hypothetical protein
MRPLNFLYEYYTNVKPHPTVLELCGAAQRDAPYTNERDDDLTVIINAWGRPEYLPLVWESVQYQTRAPKETWIIQNNPGARAAVPRVFLESVSRDYKTVVIESGLNHGCWFRFILAALTCRTRYVAIYDDDTLSGNLALETALSDMQKRPGIYGGRGVTFAPVAGGPVFRKSTASGWPHGTVSAEQVDFVGHLWVMETYWLRELLSHLPDLLLSSPNPGRECGEDMYVSFVGQLRGIPTFVFGHGGPDRNRRWSSIQGVEMGVHRNAMYLSGGLRNADKYVRAFVAEGWRLLHY